MSDELELLGVKGLKIAPGTEWVFKSDDLSFTTDAKAAYQFAAWTAKVQDLERNMVEEPEWEECCTMAECYEATRQRDLWLSVFRKSSGK